MNVDVGVITTLVGTLGGSFGGILLGHRLAAGHQLQTEIRSRRSTLYDRWLKYVDDLPRQSREAIIKDKSNHVVTEMYDDFVVMTAEVELNASLEVNRAWRRFGDRLGSGDLKKNLALEQKDTPRFDLALRKAYAKTFRPAREELLGAMRQDLGLEELGHLDPLR